MTAVVSRVLGQFLMVLLVLSIAGLAVENLFFRWLERRTILRWGMSGAR